MDNTAEKDPQKQYEQKLATIDVKFDKVSDTLGKITVNVKPEDYENEVKAELKKIGKTHSIPGFRKGHVDMGYLTRRFGKEVKSDVLNRLVADAALFNLRENKIDILAQPLPVESPKEITNDKEAYTFEYEVAIAPAVDVKVDKSVTLPYYKVEITEAMVDEQDTMLRERFGKQEPGETADAKALIKGTIMELDTDGKVKETEDAIQVVNGIVAPMFFKDKAEAEKFLNCHVNDTIVFNPWKSCEGNPAEMSSMLNIPDKEKAAEVKSDFQMTVSEIIVVKPAELGEEFYKQVFGPDSRIESEEMYRKAVASMIEAQYVSSQEVVFQNYAHKYFTSTYAGDLQLDEPFIRKWILATERGATEEQLDQDMAKIVNDTKWQLIRQAIEEKLNVKVSQNDYMGFAVQMARRQFAQYGMTNYPAEVYEDYAKKMLADRETYNRIATQVGIIALFAAVKNAVTLDVKTVSLEEFQELGKKSEED